MTAISNEVKWMGKNLSITPTITAGAYTAGDVVGGKLSFPMRHEQNGGFIFRFVVVDDDNVGATLTAWFFQNDPTTIADNAALALSVADLAKSFYKTTISTYTTHNGNKIAWVDINPAQQFTLADGIDYVYVYLSNDNGTSYTSTSGLTLLLQGYSA